MAPFCGWCRRHWSGIILLSKKALNPKHLTGGPLKPGFGLSWDVHTPQTAQCGSAAAIIPCSGVSRETNEEAQARVSAKDVGCSEVLPQRSRKILQSQGVFLSVGSPSL